MGTFEERMNEKNKTKKPSFSDVDLQETIRESLDGFKIEFRHEIRKTGEDLRLMIRGIHAEILEVKALVKGVTSSVDILSGKKPTIIKKTVQADIGGIGDSLDLLIKIPHHLRRTFEVILKMDKEVTAKDVSVETGKSRPLESDYLNQLSDRGVIRKLPKGKKVFFYYQKPSPDDHEENGLKSEQIVNNKKREIFNI